MKKIKDNFSNSNSKYKNLSKEELKEKKPRFEFLYENSSILRKKMDLIRAKNYYNEQERMTPNISKKAKNLNRPGELFYKRLYKSDNEISTDVSKIKNTTKEKNKLKSQKITKSTKDEEENKNDYNDYLKSEENLYIINNKTKNEKFSKFYNYPKFKSRNTSFIFKPIINNKSKILASKMKTNSTERLFTLSLKEKQNLNSIFLKRKNEMEISLKTEKERKRFKMNNNTYKPNVKNNKRKYIDKLYEQGINSIKQKEEQIKKERLLNEKEYLQYSFTPSINHNYSYSFFNKSSSISIDISNTKNYPNKFYRNNRTYIKNSKLIKTSFYERNINWKKLIERKKEELRKKINDDSFINEQKNLNKKSDDEIMKTDVSFIGKNFIEYQTFLDRFNYKKKKKNLDNINYRKINIPPKKVYAKKLVVEFVNECDSNCPTNAGTIRFYCDKRPVKEINKNRDKLKISDFFQNDVKLETKNFNNYGQEYIINSCKEKSNDNDASNKIVLKPNKNYSSNLSFFNAVNSLVNKIE